MTIEQMAVYTLQPFVLKPVYQDGRLSVVHGKYVKKHYRIDHTMKQLYNFNTNVEIYGAVTVIKYCITFIKHKNDIKSNFQLIS